jgi:hypothetical protein
VNLPLKYREEQFTAPEAAKITGLSLTLQRDWRSQGLLRTRTGARATFSPRELAEMRVMVKLRELGLALPASRKAAEEAAPTVIFAALANHQDQTLAVDASPTQAAAYIEALERTTSDGYLRALADLTAGDRLYRHALIQNGECTLFEVIDSDAMADDVEAAGIINLWAVARAIVETAPRPLLTLTVPRDFEAG